MFGAAEIGVLARLVHSRFGLHVVEVLARDGGQQLAFEAVRPAVESDSPSPLAHRFASRHR